MNPWLRERASWLVLAAAATSCCPAAQAQPTTGDAVTVDEFHVAATEERLWLARVQGECTVLSYRGPSGTFVPSPPLNAAVATVTAVGREAYVFQPDGSFYRYADEWMPAVGLPGPVDVVDAVALDGAPHALVPSALAALLPGYDSAAGAPSSQPFEAAEAPLSIVRYDANGWSVVAACPVGATPAVGPGLTPRMCPARGRLRLFWVSLAPPEIHYARYEPAAAGWQTAGASMPVAGLTAFWVPVVNRLPTIVANTVAPGGDTALRCYRLLAEGRALSEDVWEAAQLELSPLPATAGAARPVGAFGFNQHLGLLVAGADGSAFLRFGRFEGSPTLGTLQLPPEAESDLLPGTFQALRVGLMLAILIALFAFRRATIATPAPMPPGWELAARLRRLVGCALELAPFSVAAAVVLHVSWLEAWRQMVAWAIDPQLNDTGLPEAPLFLWWGLSAGGYTTYSLVMELATGRTVAKVLLGTRLRSPGGASPAIWQIVVRNLFRFIEVMPPFWVLGFLVLVSRNRQRVGDVFANTLAVRRTATPGAADVDDSTAEPRQ